MPGQRIYYVPPRLVGSIADWSGKDSPDGRSWLLDHAQALNFNTVWFSPFFETSLRSTIDADGQPVGNSLYATRNHGALDPEFSATKIVGQRDQLSPEEREKVDKLDREHLEYFTEQARKQGIRVMAMADLVFNHLASDHPVVLAEEAEVAKLLDKAKQSGQAATPIYKDVDGQKRVIGMHAAGEDMYFKFCRNEAFETLNIGMTTGYDTAQLNYDSPAAKEFFVTGKDGQNGYWKHVIDWCIDQGLQDFRCDIAYRLPPDWWQEIIEHTRQRNPDAVFMAETLGGPDAAIARMAEIKVKDANGVERPGFDLGMISNYWWNFTDDWLPDQEIPRLKKMAKFGGAASPDNHDTPTTLAGHFQKALKDNPNRDRAVADIGVRNYAVSAFIGNSVYMQMGYELSKEKQNGVFKGQVTPQDWSDLVAERPEGHVLNISSRIKAINDLKDQLHVENSYVNIKQHCEMQGGKLIKMALEYVDADTGKKTADIVLVINKQPEAGAVTVTDPALLSLENSELKRMGAAGENRPSVRDVLVYHTPVENITPAVVKQPLRAPKRASPNAP